MTYADKIYTALCMLFTSIIIIGNLTYQKFIALPLLPFHTFEISVGSLLYPLTFLITDLIAEFYGREKARYCVNFTIIISIISALIITLMNTLPATSWSKIDDATFDFMFGLYSMSFIGSITAFYSSQWVDISVYLWLKKATNGKYLGLRNNLSTAISLLADTVIVVTFMYMLGVVTSEHMLKLILNSYGFKIFFTICSTPLFYLSAHCIRKLIAR